MDLFAYFLIRSSENVHIIIDMLRNKNMFSLSLFDFDSTAIRLFVKGKGH